MKAKSKRTRSVILIVLGIVVSMGLISYQFKPSGNETTAEEEASKPTEQSAATTGTFTLKKENLDLLKVKGIDRKVALPISGRVIAKNETNIHAEVQGRVLDLGFKLREGVYFKAGDVLLQLDSKEFELQLEAQRSAFLNIMTGIMPDVKADYPDSYEYWLAYVENYESGQSLAPLPTVKSDAERYFLTSNQVYSTFYTIKAQEERLSKFRVIAPYSGLVTAAHVDRGTLVAPGQMLGTIISNGNYELEAAASIEVVAQLKIGDQISFSNNSLDGRWTGSVIRINDIVDPRTQNIPVYLDIWGEGLRVGMYLEGSVDGVAHKGVFAIPASVLTRDEKVLLLQDNTIGSKQVELVEMMEDSILVKGLTNDDLLVINSFEVPVEGLKLSL